jgi:hypothetical protein
MPTNAGDAIPIRPEGLSEALRGFGPAGLLALLAIFSADVIVKPASAILVLLWARWSRTPWSEIGYARPRSWIRGLAFGLLFGSVCKVFLKSVVMQLLGADPINRAYHHLAFN